MSCRAYFRQLRREQWNTDAGFFLRMDKVFPGPAQFTVTAVQPTSEKTLEAVEAIVRVLFCRARADEFFSLHEAVCFGDVRIAEIVAPAQMMFPERLPWRYADLAEQWGRRLW